MQFGANDDLSSKTLFEANSRIHDDDDDVVFDTDLPGN